MAKTKSKLKKEEQKIKKTEEELVREFKAKAREDYLKLQKKMVVIVFTIFAALILILTILFGMKRGDYVILDVMDDTYKVVDRLNHLEILDKDNKSLVRYRDVNTDKIKYNKEKSDYVDGKLFLVFSDTHDEKCYEYIYDTNNKNTSKDSYSCKKGNTELVKKPVIYIYPTEDISVNIKFEHADYLTTTYPKYNNGWNVKANKDGSLYDYNNNYYYALYYEEIFNNNIDFSKGFYVTGDDASEFLEKKLTLIGLNEKERNEMIMYWLPVLEENKKSLVYFELTNEREEYNKLLIEPIPESLLRVSIHIKKVNREVDIEEQLLPKFSRTGYTVVEWGGVIHK